MRDQIKEADYVLMVCKNIIKDERRQRFTASFEQAKCLALNDIYVTEGNPHILDIDKQHQNITPQSLSELLKLLLGAQSTTVVISSLP